jgi:hypothetical protein
MPLLDRIGSWKGPVFLLSLLSYWHTGVMILSHEVTFVCRAFSPLRQSHMHLPRVRRIPAI